MKVRRAALLGVLLGAVLGAPRPLHAKEASSVTVVSPPHAAPLVEEAVIRLSAELRAAGFDVHLVEAAPGGDGRAQVEGDPAAPPDGRAGEPFATIAFVTTDRGAFVDLWVADHVTRKTLVRRLDIGDAAASNAASDLAVRTVELLRASLLEVATAPAARQPDLPATLQKWIDAPRPPPPPVPRAHVASIEAAFAVLAAGSFRVAPVPLLRVAVELPQSLAIRAFVAPAITTTTLGAAAGTVAIRQTVAAIDLAWAFGLSHERIYPVISVGGGLYDLQFDGQAAGPLALGHEGRFLSAALTTGAGLRVRILPHLSAFADLQVVTLQTEPVVTIVDAQAGRAGRPAFLPAVGLAAYF